MSQLDPSALETPKTFPLIAPIQTGETQVSEITLREPTAGEAEQLQKDTVRLGDAGAVIQLIAKQTKLPPSDIRQLGARDFNNLQVYLGSFFTLPGESSGS